MTRSHGSVATRFGLAAFCALAGSATDDDGSGGVGGATAAAGGESAAGGAARIPGRDMAVNGQGGPGGQAAGGDVSAPPDAGPVIPPPGRPRRPRSGRREPGAPAAGARRGANATAGARSRGRPLRLLRGGAHRRHGVFFQLRLPRGPVLPEHRDGGLAGALLCFRPAGPTPGGGGLRAGHGRDLLREQHLYRGRNRRVLLHHVSAGC